MSSSRAVLVTGAAGGIGRGIVRRFLREGAQVAAVDRDEQALARLADENGPNVLPIVADVSSWSANRDAVAQTIDQFGGLDVLVGNAGIYDHATPLAAIPGDQLESAFDELFAVNVSSYLYAARAAAGPLATRRGCMIFTASYASFSPAGGGILYTAAKHAVLGIIRQLAYELAPDVRVNGVAPGVAPTRLAGITALGQAPRDSVLPGSAGALPLGAVPDADAYGGLYTMLASPDAAAMTGSIITADSGLAVRGIASPNGSADRPDPSLDPDLTPLAEEASA